MSKAYWISAYRSITDKDALAAYGQLAGPAIQAGGGRFLARGPAAVVFEAGIAERTVIIEFDSLDQAVATYRSPAYQEALKALGTGADREVRIVEGVA